MSGGLPDFGTFMPILAAAVERRDGPVLELGVGDCSTPMLSFLCCGRSLVSAETDRGWLDKYIALYANGFHEYHLIPASTVKDPRYHTGWAEWKRIEEIEWAVALVDHAPGERRIEEVKRLKDRCRWIVCHDVEELEENPTSGGAYLWKEVLPLFKHVYIWKAYRPWTAVLSNFEAFDP